MSCRFISCLLTPANICFSTLMEYPVLSLDLEKIGQVIVRKRKTHLQFNSIALGSSFVHSSRANHLSSWPSKFYNRCLHISAFIQNAPARCAIIILKFEESVVEGNIGICFRYALMYWLFDS